MKLTIILMTAVFIQVSARGVSQTISYSGQDVPLATIIKEVEKQTGFTFAYNVQWLLAAKPVTIKVSQVPLASFLFAVFKDQSLNYSVKGTTIFISRKESIVPPDTQPDALLADMVSPVTGRITDASGAPLSGATLAVRGSSRTTTTTADGTFTLNVNEGEVIRISYVGYESQEIKITAAVIKAGIIGSVNLAVAVSSLDDVTIQFNTGYQTVSKERATGSFGAISAEQLKKIPTPNILHRLEGQIPGVQLQIQGGDNTFLYSNTTPNLNNNTNLIGVNDYSIRIRGNSSIASDRKPLLVIDGFPSEMDMRTLNPDDVAQITFLRDAAAASIWGARAANGVIVVETKKGKNTRATEISFSTGFTFYGKPSLNKLHLISSADEINYEQELVNKNIIANPLTVSGAVGTFTYPTYVSEAMDLTFQLKGGLIDSANYKSQLAVLASRNGYKDIEKYLLRAANSQNYNLSFSGGNDMHTFYLSGSYANENTSSRRSGGKRYTFDASEQLKLYKRITLSVNLKGTFFDQDNNGLGVAPLGSAANTYLPYNQMANANGSGIGYSYRYYHRYTDSLQKLGLMPWTYNYLQELNEANNNIKDASYSAIFNLNIPIWKGLAVSGQYSLEKSNQQIRTFASENTFATRTEINEGISFNSFNGAINYNVPAGGIYSLVKSDQTNYSARGQITYSGHLADAHELNVVAGTEIRQTSQEQSTARLYGYNMNTGFSSTPAAQYTNWKGNTIYTYYNLGSEAEKTRRFLSYYGNVAYTFLNRYTLSASSRYDDYNNFGLDRKYRAKPFWSSGLAWNITREGFIQNNSWVNNLSLRLTYGINGNINQGIFPFTNIALGGNDYITNLPVAFISSPANPALRWEKTAVTNVGIDFAFFNSRLGGSVDVYSKKGTDLIYQFDIDPTYGLSSLSLNTASISNRGIDAGINGTIINGKKWGWKSSITFSYNKNKVTDNRFKPTTSFFNYPLSGTIEGYASDAMFVYRNAGLDATGMTQIYDEKNSIVKANASITSINALKYAGRTTAPYYGAWNNTFSYKQISLYVLATYQFGSVFLRPVTRSYAPTRSGGFSYDLNADKAMRWRKAGDEATTDVPGIAGTYSSTSLIRYQLSDINVLSGDYIRLREVSLSWNVPGTLLKNVVKGASVGVTARNLGLIWKKNDAGIDPDFIPNLTTNTLRLPPVSSFAVNLSVNL